METFQDLSLPIPGKEDLAKLHSAIYQNVPAKPGACGDSYAAQGWLAFIVEYIRRYAPFRPLETQDHPDLDLKPEQAAPYTAVQAFAGMRARSRRELEAAGCVGVSQVGQGCPCPLWGGLDLVGPWIGRQVMTGVAARKAVGSGRAVGSFP